MAIPSFLQPIVNRINLPNGGGTYGSSQIANMFPTGTSTSTGVGINSPTSLTSADTRYTPVVDISKQATPPVVQNNPTAPIINNQSQGPINQESQSGAPIITEQNDPNAAARSFMEEFRKDKPATSGGVPSIETGANNLYNQWMQERNSNTGMFTLPQNVSLSPDHINAIRKAADNYYSGLVSTATDLEKAKGSQIKGYGADSDLAGLSTNAVNTIYKMSDDFNSHPIVKNFNTIQRAVIDANNLNKQIQTTGAKAGDDLQMIYMFAKAQDPDSVVREGEYATAQKYLSSLLQGTKYQISRATDGTPTAFLSPEARSLVVNSLNRKYNSDKQQYDQLRSDTVTHMKGLAGKDVSGTFLNNYAGAMDSNSEIKSTGTLPGGSKYGMVNGKYVIIK